jgi:hypothetical protein
MIVSFIILCVLAVVYVTPVKGEEEYHLIATLQSPAPHGYGAFGGDSELGEDFLVIGECYALVNEGMSVGRGYIFDFDWNLITSIQSHFASSIDVLDDLIIVGNPDVNIDDFAEAGKAYLFNTGGSLLLTLQSPNPMTYGNFGAMVNFGKDTIVVSEIGGSVQGFNSPGLVHVFDMEGDLLTTFMSPSPKPYGRFGNFMDVSDEFIVIGEVGEKSRPKDDCTVYVFDYSWNPVATLQSPDQQIRSQYGRDVDIENDLLLVCEMWATVDGHEKAGRAHLYDTDWNLITSFQAPDPEDHAEFGRGVKIGGDLIIIGERFRDVTVMNEGKVYVYDLEGNPLTTLVSPEPTIAAQFGFRVESDGEFIVVSELEATAGGVSKAGRVHIFGLGEPAVVEPVDEGEPVVEEDAEETQSGGGIPGFPYESLLVGVVSAVLVLWSIQRRR